MFLYWADVNISVKKRYRPNVGDISCVNSGGLLFTIPNYFRVSSEFAVNVGSLSECYFAGKGTAVVLSNADPITQTQGPADGVTATTENSQSSPKGDSGANPNSTPIHHHLRCMFRLLRNGETLKMVKDVYSVKAS
ncbi:hypothetical protein GWI33_017593 [Rhynchophorus ferrugineus]|uniref:Uncharacterized protein n=1 Tax=Rhynchophorus ferrugineus TaxID=354439 RepID=A0A834HYZ6_RHYFE|nr:hypothetical protein GWI33_017593 [Rhynchophorus ferrugineus]